MLDHDLTDEKPSDKSVSCEAKSADTAKVKKQSQFSQDAIAALTHSANAPAATRIETQRDKLVGVGFFNCVTRLFVTGTKVFASRFGTIIL